MKRLFDNLSADITSSKKLGFKFFIIGIFLLASAPALSGIFLFLALIIGSLKRSDSYFRDKWNYLFLAGGIFMVISSCVSLFSTSAAYREIWDPSLSWIGLLNWLPFFWCFWGFQPYLLTSNTRKICALCFVAGSIPVLITGFGQYWMGWHGPFQLFNGLIIWFQRPIHEMQGLTGLFNNSNYAGSWLTIVWPFCLAALLQPSLNIFRRIIVFSISSSFVTAIILTNSRNAWGGLLFPIPFVLGPSNWSWLVPISLLVLFPIFTAIVPFAPSGFQDWARTVVPERIWVRFSEEFSEFENYPRARLDIWKNAIKFISDKPLFGWGAAAFAVLYRLLGETGYRQEHTHNLPFELAFGYGIPASLFIFANIFALLIFSLRKSLFFNNKLPNTDIESSLFARAWWSSSLFLLCSHMLDIPYFDARISIAFWILLAGLRGLIRESSEYN